MVVLESCPGVTGCGLGFTFVDLSPPFLIGYEEIEPTTMARSTRSNFIATLSLVRFLIDTDNVASKGVDVK